MTSPFATHLEWSHYPGQALQLTYGHSAAAAAAAAAWLSPLMSHSHAEREEGDDYFFTYSHLDLAPPFASKEAARGLHPAGIHSGAQSNGDASTQSADPAAGTQIQDADDDEIGDEIHLANMAFMNANKSAADQTTGPDSSLIDT